MNIKSIIGHKSGPKVVIMGAVHGNEELGEAVVTRLLQEIKPKNLFGVLTLILGNPAAFAKKKRFVDTDLNRLFGPEIENLIKKPLKTLNTEERRAVEIAPFLKAADYLLDIHSTIKPSVAFMFCKKTKAHLQLSGLFETKYIVSPTLKCQIPDLSWCCDNYVDQNGGIGITYETGWYKDPTDLNKIMSKVYLYLNTIGSLETNPKILNPKETKATQVIIYDYILPQSSNFYFRKNLINFEIVKKDETIAIDGNNLFKAKKKSLIVFPKINTIPGIPACYLATI